MSLFGMKCVVRQVAVLALFVVLPVIAVSAQSSMPAAPSASQPQQFQLKDYSKPRGYFPGPLAPYRAQHVAPPNLDNTSRIDGLMRGGKLYLSMDDAVALALENNLDIAIARYNLNIADTDVLRTKAGAPFLGVNTGIVQGTPGGGVGGLGGSIGTGTGGTSVGAGGAGAGLGGLVSSTLGSGPTITSFDPVITGTMQMDRAFAISSNAFNFGLPTTTHGFPLQNQNTGTANFSFQQGFHTGTALSVGFNNTHTTTNSTTSTFSPLTSSGLQIKLTQSLLQGLGFAPNTRFIRIAKNNREISDVAFRLQVITTVDQIENMYWALVFAYENMRVAQESLAFAQKTLSDTKKQVEIGTLAPIEIVRAQSTVATDQQVLTVAQNNLQLQQLLMKNALSRTLSDPRLADAEVIPMSIMSLPAEEPVMPIQDLVNAALGHRAELAEARINLTNTEISNKAVRNALLPTLNLFAYYGGSGVGGAQNPSATCVPGSTNPFCIKPGTIPTVNYGDTLNDLVNSTAPDKGMGLTLNIPIRNRAAQATQVRSELEYRQAQMRLQQIENIVRVEVRNAQFTLQQNRASVQSAQAAVDLARQSLDAEQKKYALGASTSTLVLQNESALATAESNLASAKTAYVQSRIELDRATGLLLDHAGILISDAERGQVTHMPTVPLVAPRPADSAPAQPVPQQQ